MKTLGFNLTTHPYFLEFIHPFALAHGTRTGTDLAFVKIEHKGITAFGEASLPPYRKETYNTVKSWVESKKEETLHALSYDPFSQTELIPFSKEHPAASAALQSAILHWYALAQEKKISAFFAITPATTALTLTITKNDFPFLGEKLKLEQHFNYFKIKLTGSKDDLEFVEALRNKTELPFCIDINQGYADKEIAIRLIDTLQKLNCVLIEQPLKDTNHEGHYWLKQRTTLPIIADESICFYDDLVNYHEAYSGVNVKLMKCGGLLQAQQMLAFAKEKKLLKLIGCMSESSLGVATASVLSSHADMADLDAPYLNSNDPFEGFAISHKKIELGNEILLKTDVHLS